MNFILGVGASGAHAERNVAEGIARVSAHPSMRVVGTSRWYENPAFGGVTTQRFVNAAMVIDTPLCAQALLRGLHAIERALGRVRGVKNGARSLDLDVLWALDAFGPSSLPAVPHPFVLERPFAVVPAVDAIERAGRVVPEPLRVAARAAGIARMTVVGSCLERRIG